MNNFWEHTDDPIKQCENEILECNHCINGLCNTMKQMKVPQKEWGNNVMIKAYLERIEKAKQKLNELKGM